MRKFLAKHATATTGTLSCFDRLLFKGHLPLGYPNAMEVFLTLRGVLFKDLKAFVLKTIPLPPIGLSIASRNRCGITTGARPVPSIPRLPPTSPSSQQSYAANTCSTAFATATCAPGSSARPRRPIPGAARRSRAS